MSKQWTVASLIKELQKYDDRITVYIDSGCGCCGDGNEGIIVEHFKNKESTLQIGSVESR